ncbi:MAG: phage head closure protein [Mogibacterium sp.]|nr:phage head closure protein [Mogibacterium sp.]
MDDVIILVKTTYTRDEEGNMIPSPAERQVLCRNESVSRSEYYQAAQVGMHPEYIFVLSHFMDYEGEKFIRYTDWMNRIHELYVTRTYRRPNSTELEIVAGERTGHGNEHESGSGA